MESGTMNDKTNELIRLDRLLMAKGLAASREKAKELIENGCVTVNGKNIRKAGTSVAETDEIKVSMETFFAGDYHSDEIFVSRAGHKLAKALAYFNLSPEGAVCLDAGASTGGFTDCLIRRGAAYVYAVDVGHDQFDRKLALNEKITVREGVNVRYLGLGDFPGPLDWVTADLSFISLDKVFTAFQAVLKPSGTLICLIKPQFEAGPGAVDKNGVIRDPAVHLSVLKKVVRDALLNGLTVKGITYSPILGPEGNAEFLLYAVKEMGIPVSDQLLEKTVNEAKTLTHRERG